MSTQTIHDKLSLLGVDIDILSMSDAIDYIMSHSAPGHKARYIIKPYVEFLDQSYHNQSLRELLNSAELALADGVALLWAAHYLYAGPRSLGRFWLTLMQIIFRPTALTWPLPDRAAGINFTWPLLEAAALQHRRVYIIGKEHSPELKKTLTTISTHLPEIQIVGSHLGVDPRSPYRQVSEAWLTEVIADLQHTQPDLILVGMGFPLQERVCAHLAAHTSHGLYIGEGGTFDYQSFGGTRPKAPHLVQRLGLEWLYRLLQQPSRLRRQLAIPHFIWHIWRNR